MSLFRDSNRLSRRNILGVAAGAAGLAALSPFASAAFAAELKGRIKQSVCLWCYNGRAFY